MTREALLAWLGDREPRPPAGLATALANTAGASEALGDGLPDVLADLAFTTLDRVAGSRGDDRRAADELLIADALITYALEAMAAREPEALARFAHGLARRGGAGI